MSAENINVGFIGVGGHAEISHIEQLAAQSDCSITALADLNTDRLQEIQDRHAPGARLSTDWHEIIDDPAVDVVLIMTPDRFHTQQLIAAVNGDKHVFVEKPIATTWSDYELAKNGLLLAREKGLVVSTCHPRRFDPPFVNTKRFLDDRRLLTTFGLDPNTDLGPIKKFSLSLNYSRPTKTGLHDSFASDHLPHEMDTASHFFGFSGIRRAVSRLNEELEFDVEAEREDGILLRFKGNRLQEKRSFREDWQIEFADNTVLSVDAETGTTTLIHKDQPVELTLVDAADKPMFKTNYNMRFEELNAHVIRSIMQREKERPYLTDGDMLMNTVAGLALQEVGKVTSISADGHATVL